MKVYTEVHLKDFDTWCGANSTKDSLFEYELDIIEECLEELFPDGLSETQINDILWFERDWVLEKTGADPFLKQDDAIEVEAEVVDAFRIHDIVVNTRVGFSEGHFVQRD